MSKNDGAYSVRKVFDPKTFGVRHEIVRVADAKKAPKKAAEPKPKAEAASAADEPKAEKKPRVRRPRVRRKKTDSAK